MKGGNGATNGSVVTLSSTGEPAKKRNFVRFAHFVTAFQ